MNGNEAAARVAYQLNEVIALFPITPASPMGESADSWSAAGIKNLGPVPSASPLSEKLGSDQTAGRRGRVGYRASLFVRRTHHF
jgi:pyruvate-ferredoxin/flavodoxin oxidoreductase